MIPASVARVLDSALENRPDATAVVARSGSLTYVELDARADSAAGALWELGVRPGDRVAACLPNDLDVVVAFHGSQRLGAIWAGIGEGLAAPEQRLLAGLCEPTLVLAGRHDQVEPAAVLRGHLLPHLPHATLDVLPGSGHLLPLEAPAGVAARLEAFLVGLGT